MTTKAKISLAFTVILIAFAFGRWSAPEKVKIEKEIVEVASTKKEESKDVKTNAERDKRVERVTTEIVRPDGTRETSTRVVEDSTTRKRSDSATDSREESATSRAEKSTETIERGGSRLSLSVLAGATLSLSSGVSLGPVIYGAHASRPILGPITVGLWGLSSGAAGVSVGLIF